MQFPSRKSMVLAALASLLMACGGSSSSVVITGNDIARINVAMNDIMDRHAPPGIVVAVITNTDRDQNFFDDLVSGLIEAVDGITVWPETDLFPQYR